MSEQSVDERIAREVMGWFVYKPSNKTRELRYRLPDTKRGWSTVPDFEHSLDACALAEAEIVRREMRDCYAWHLQNTWLLECPLPDMLTWRNWAIFATPAQRCVAMLKVVEASNG